MVCLNLKKQALDYVKNGGNLLVIGASAVKEFEPQLGVTFEGAPQSQVCTMGMNNEMSAVKTVVQLVKAGRDTQIFGELYDVDDFRFPTGSPVATIASYGKGKIAGFYLDIANAYYTYQARGYLKIMNAVVNKLFPNPIVTVTGSDYVHTTINQKDGRWYVHLINTSGSHFNQRVYEYDHIPATGDLTMELNTPKPVKKVVLQPGAQPLQYHLKNGKAYFTVPSVAIHTIVQLEF